MKKFIQSLNMNKSKVFSKIDLYEYELDNVFKKYIEENIPYDITSKIFDIECYKNIRHNIQMKFYQLIDSFSDEKYLFTLSDTVKDTPLTITSGYYSADIDYMELDNEKPLMICYSFFIDSISKDKYIKGFALYNKHRVFMIKGIERVS